MKKSLHIPTTHYLSEFTNSINETNRSAAMNAYLKKDLHTQFLLAGLFVQQCDDSSRNLKLGNIAPRLDICCCRATFAAILSGTARITYCGSSLPVDYDWVRQRISDEERDRVLTQAEYVTLSRLHGTRLIEVLEYEFECETTTFVAVHEKDHAAQRAYYEALVRRFRTAAEYAVAIGSSSAALWMEAIRQLQPHASLQPGQDVPPDHACDLDLRKDEALAAYDAAEKAQAQLWVDDALRGVKPLKVCKSRRTGR